MALLTIADIDSPMQINRPSAILENFDILN